MDATETIERAWDRGPTVTTGVYEWTSANTVSPVFVRTRGEVRAAAIVLGFDIPTERDIDNMISTGLCCGRPIVWVD